MNNNSYSMDKIESLEHLDFNTRKQAMESFSFQMSDEPEMTEFESAFLCGMLEKYNPKKILEVGVAAGGTTAITLKKLENREEVEMYSCDLSKEFYRNKPIEGKRRRTGFLADKLLKTTKVKHKFVLGHYLPEVLDQIGGGIDFVILDTVHSLPGEVLDFLAFLPYLAKNAVIVLHDISYNFSSIYSRERLATNALYDVVAANKILNFVPEKYAAYSVYPNIGAFVVNEDTWKYINNVFSAFMLLWTYIPGEQELAIYRKHYAKYYDESLIRIFDEAVILQKKQAMEPMSLGFTVKKMLSPVKHFLKRKIYYKRNLQNLNEHIRKRNTKRLDKNVNEL